ncbi:MAG: S1C family serine protease [Planctomycetota bacterium]
MKRTSFPCLALVLSAALAAQAAEGPTEDTSESLAALDRVLAAAAERAEASVVQVKVERNDYGPTQLSRAERAALGLQGYVPPNYFSRPEGPVTGVVIAPGLVATSMWNVEGEGAVSVIGPDGTRYAAERAGRDEALRVAVLRVKDQGALRPIAQADAAVATGRTLLLVGRSANNRATVTAGIVSGLKRERGAAFTHSCRTSFGNVGGALIDMEGRLVGVAVRHTNRASQGQASGVGFGAEVKRLAPNLEALAQGKVIPAPPRAFLGIGLDQAYTGEGVRVGRVIENTAAATAGVKSGDVITVFNSVKIEHFNQLVEEILKLAVGAEIVVTVKRGAEELDFKVKLGARPEDQR